MTIGNLLCSAVALGTLVAGHPVGRQLARRNYQAGSDIILYDSSVTEPKRVPQVLVWVDDAGKAISTATDMVLLLPTSLALGAESKDSTATTPMTALATQTLAVPHPSTPGKSTSDSKAGDKNGVAVLPADAVPLASTAKNPPRSTSSDSGTPTGQTSLLVPGTGKPQDGRPVSSSAPDSPRPSAERFGISYAPYRSDHSCKSAKDIMDDFRLFARSYSVVRIYGTDCDQVANVKAAAKAFGVKVFLGIWQPSAVADESSKIIAGINGDWDMVHSVSVGNELVNNGQASPQQVIAGVKSARATLRAAGYKGPVVAVDTFVAVKAHPELCEESDYCAINAHAFFDSTVAASDAGRWLQNTVSDVKSVLSTPKKVMVTETGWPMDGNKNGLAVPSIEDQQSAINSIKKEFAATPGNIILFSAFNDLWKTKSESTFNAEQFWGIDGALSAS